MKIFISWYPYRRNFRNPLRTASGLWHLREGFLIESTYGTRKTWTEIAPMPNFGTETIEEAHDFLVSINGKVDFGELKIPDRLPCCAYALTGAKHNLFNNISDDYFKIGSFPVAGFLGSGSKVFEHFRNKKLNGFKTFKWKIGVDSFEKEWETFTQIASETQKDLKFRLDANASLDLDTAERWLQAVADFNSGISNKPMNIEFFEQPMAVGYELEMERLSKKYGIPIALDESLNGSKGSQWLRNTDWRGPLVLKPSLQGPFDSQIAIVSAHSSQCVLSSSFETIVGLNQSLRLAAIQKSQIGNKDSLYAMGFDTQNLFEDPFGIGISNNKPGLGEIKLAVQRVMPHVF
mgnify:CR=1 FL=1